MSNTSQGRDEKLITGEKEGRSPKGPAGNNAKIGFLNNSQKKKAKKRNGY